METLAPCELAVFWRADYLRVVAAEHAAELRMKARVIQANPVFGCLSEAQRAQLEP